jgi:hypothetical protein
MDIVFTDVRNSKGVLSKPKPASEYIPDWYKDAKSYMNPDGKKTPTLDNKPVSTVKRCMPVWDMMTAGYILETSCDIYVHQTPEGPLFQWSAPNGMIFQDMEQFQDHPYSRDINYAVRIDIPWAITTPKGWSIMVIEPQHREPGPLVCSSGIVDTDTYGAPFNMFFKLRDSKFEGMIPAGTPFLQVIPFKRENWESTLGDEKEKNHYNSIIQKFNTVFFDRYKNFWWNKKTYK